jgi:hypothetical protein
MIMQTIAKKHPSNLKKLIFCGKIEGLIWVDPEKQNTPIEKA